MSRPDLDLLLNKSIELAKEQLSKRGEFAPFAFVLQEGKPKLEMAYTDEKTKTLLEKLNNSLKETAKDQSVSAIACVIDVKISDPIKSDAIAIQLENRAESIVSHLPYAKNGSEIQYGEIMFSQGVKEFFAE